MHFTCDCDRCIHAEVCRFIDVLSNEKVQEAERAIDTVNFPEYITFHMVCGAFKENPDAIEGNFGFGMKKAMVLKNKNTD